MTDFIINVKADAGQAQRTTQALGKNLDRLEREATEFRNSLNAALSQRDRGTTGVLRGIEQILARTEERAIITDTRISRIGKDINTAGVRRLNDELDKSSRNAARLGQLLRRITAGVGVGLIVREYIQLSDVLANAQNRLRLVTNSSEELASVQQRLFDISERSRSSFEGTATIFSRLAVSADELGTTNEKLLDFTESLNQAIILSGASSQEASQGLIQLSQGLASGALRGDELRSVLEQLPAVADVIASELGVTRGELRELGKQGAITSDIILKAFASARGELADKFAKTIPTIGQSFEVLKTQLIDSVGSFNQVTGASEALSKGILAVSENLPAITTATVVFSTALGVTLAGKAIPAAITGLVSLKVATIASTAAFAAAGLAVFAASQKFQQYTEDLKAIDQAQKDVARSNPFAVQGTQIEEAKRRINEITRATESGGLVSAEVRASQIKQIENLTNKIAQLRGEIRGEAADQLAKINVAKQQAEAETANNANLERQNTLLNSILSPAKEYQDLQADLSVLLKNNAISQEQFTLALERGKKAFESSQDIGKVAKTEVEDPFAKQVESLRKQNEQLSIRANNFGIQQEALLIEAQLAANSIKLNDTQKNLLSSLLVERLKNNEAIKEKAAIEAQNAATEAANAGRLSRLREELDVQGALNQQEKDLLALRETELNLIPQIDAALAKVRAAKAAGNDEEVKALNAKKRAAEEFNAVIIQIADSVANRATAAISDFAETGKFAFKDFASAVLKDIQNIIIRLLVVKAINAGLGAAGFATGVGGESLNAGRRGGGTVQPGQNAFPVNEGGQEVFVPDRTGTIVPNAADVRQAPPQVNINLVTVDDQQRFIDFLDSDQAGQTIVNQIGRNRDKARRVQAGR